MPDLIQWPRNLVARATNLRVRPMTRSAGEAINGFEQVGSALSAKWQLQLTFNNLKFDRILAYRAILAAMNGRENWLRFPINDRTLWPTDAALGLARGIPHSDGALFSDGTGYATNDIGGVVVSGELGDKAVTIGLAGRATGFQAGQYFGAGEDLYISKSVIYDSSGNAAVKFEPSFRRDYDGATFRLRPYLICRATTDDTGDHNIEYGRQTAPALDLMEVPHELVS